MKSLGEFCTLIPSNVNNVCVTVNEAIGFIKSSFYEVNDDILFELKVVLNELLLNAIKHGNKEENSRCVKISVGFAMNSHIYIIVEDEGEGFKYPEDKCCFNFECDDLLQMKETGRGIMIVKNLCDCVKFNARGNKVVVLKKIT